MLVQKKSISYTVCEYHSWYESIRKIENCSFLKIFHSKSTIKGSGVVQWTTSYESLTRGTKPSCAGPYDQISTLS